MSGANSTTKALDLQAQLIQMLSSAGLVLRKWASNCNELTNLIQEDLRLPNASLSIDDGTVKTLDAFIAALKRFISRRGKCSDIFSDCGSKFVGAKTAEISEVFFCPMRVLFLLSENAGQCSNQDLTNYFNPERISNQKTPPSETISECMTPSHKVEGQRSIGVGKDCIDKSCDHERTDRSRGCMASLLASRKGGHAGVDNESRTIW
ncbi:hypothetical protein CEXT_132991 [Caerostris extrusa]|uniref:Uncharacterized protein n=1 Tax=Caerostris extrusa TaxID=172846 RepID=A0AAV4SC77_CAEEX|nr:hypothetical protein CEXT_132991 [Caerostris extrusa]